MSNQASFLLQKVAPLVIREISPHITSKVTPYITEKIGIPIAKKVGLPIARRIGIPIARKAGNFFISRVGYPLVNKVLFKNNLDGLLKGAGLGTTSNTKTNTGSIKPGTAPLETTPPAAVKTKKRRSLKEMIPRPGKAKKKTNLKITPKSYPGVKNDAPIPIPAAPKPYPTQTSIPQQDISNHNPYPDINYGNSTLFGRRRNVYPY